ncbi:hypothetical protein [Sporosarcina sp. P33]|uniref:hypothetical protein n=1 Tax=Sporosarcina sp. P33 TaxID=1930764 RepID=UPI0009BF38C2|nr:hypothetical protein [Sporosarcina sp. P33]ARD46818.1 hypothetical protein SporoP33_00250 [Sporosarcina sp. P33]
MDNIQTDKNFESAETYAAKLEFLGSVLSIAGESLQIAAAITLQELENEKKNKRKAQKQSERTIQLELIQKQIDDLTKRVGKLEQK